MKRWGYICIAAILLGATAFGAAVLYLRPNSSSGAAKPFEVQAGEGFGGIAERLESEGLIRSALAFKVYVVLSGKARHLKPGYYSLYPSLSIPEVAGKLALGIDREAVVTIPEGSTMFDIDEILAKHGVLERGAFLKFAQEGELEGYLFPDTYRFYLRSDIEAVRIKFATAFEARMRPVLDSAKPGELSTAEILTLASILEREVPEEHDRQVVAGLLLKRMEEGMPLQVDASVCYAKRIAHPEDGCYPVTELDTRTESPYNSYLHQGLPPGPIGNPGISAVKAALSPIESAYWYYLSDPVTKTTIFSKTLAEHEANRARYLLQPTH